MASGTTKTMRIRPDEDGLGHFCDIIGEGPIFATDGTPMSVWRYEGGLVGWTPIRPATEEEITLYAAMRAEFSAAGVRRPTIRREY